MRIKCLCLFVFSVLFLITGCSDATLVPAIVEKLSPPSFSFLEIDPNNTDLEYVTRMQEYDMIIQSSSVPVFIINQDDLHEEFYTMNGVKKEYFGLFIEGNNIIREWPKEFFFLRKSVSAEQIVTSYFHELQHYKCVITKCICSDKNSELADNSSIISAILREKHAMVNELEMGWGFQDQLLVCQSVQNIISYIIVEDTNLVYKMAAISVTEEEIWNKSIDYFLKKE